MIKLTFILEDKDAENLSFETEVEGFEDSKTVEIRYAAAIVAVLDIFLSDTPENTLKKKKHAAWQEHKDKTEAEFVAKTIAIKLVSALDKAAASAKLDEQLKKMKDMATQMPEPRTGKNSGAPVEITSNERNTQER